MQAFPTEKPCYEPPETDLQLYPIGNDLEKLSKIVRKRCDSGGTAELHKTEVNATTAVYRSDITIATGSWPDYDVLDPQMTVG